MIFNCEFGTIDYRTPGITKFLEFSKSFGSSLSVISEAKGLNEETIAVYLKLIKYIFIDEALIKEIKFEVDGELVDTFEKLDARNELFSVLMSFCGEFLGKCFGASDKKKS